MGDTWWRSQEKAGALSWSWAKFHRTIVASLRESAAWRLIDKNNDQRN